MENSDHRSPGSSSEHQELGETSDNIPLGRTIVLSDTFVKSLDVDQLRGYLDALTDVAANEHADVDAAADDLSGRLAPLGIEIAPVELNRIAEHLFGGGPAEITIKDSFGDVLRHQPGGAHVPAEQPAATDPEHPARPAAFD
ncbi:hypothetical protein [Yimella sp. cx-51]|uniref:hypothetical protein n=1 Tax=Yimella sp. cx-51 TaxID=2770551 RepID=UPI00165DE32B|nr:hypothetical protein [Yimella sp. cx-51]MBC9957959.1 hypothetical protein [Yimella sp. cx-51]MBD2760700.1 hypothetical protein [Yimella sp. cx-573]QTH38089.1 hypothetical protein J5M86_14885 [Yimella sp. cx-51]